VPGAAQIRTVWKPLAHLACALSLVVLVLELFNVGPFRLGANPGLAIRDTLGTWGLRLLLVTLAMTPLRMVLGKPWPLAFRRLLGLWAFAYVTLHFVTYFLFDRASVAAVVADVIKRPYITIGFAAFLLLVPLAVTSTAGWRRELGPRWITLHRLVYPIAILGVWHYWWLVKKDITEPAVYAVVLAGLLGWRLLPRGPGPSVVERQGR
jgi:sulfoxide reductase heme-binding subunit YedZ